LIYTQLGKEMQQHTDKQVMQVNILLMFVDWSSWRHIFMFNTNYCL